MHKEQLSTTIKQHKKWLAYFDSCQYAHGCIVDKENNPYLFWLDENPIFMPNKYYLEYECENNKSGITIAKCSIWIIPTDEHFILIKLDDLLEGIMMEGWKKFEKNNKKYFIIPQLWLNQKGKIFKYVD